MRNTGFHSMHLSWIRCDNHRWSQEYNSRLFERIPIMLVVDFSRLVPVADIDADKLVQLLAIDARKNP